MSVKKGYTTIDWIDFVKEQYDRTKYDCEDMVYIYFTPYDDFIYLVEYDEKGIVCKHDENSVAVMSSNVRIIE